ncbi:hypothetical protein K1719_013508 [Acacia pycnantha]|nr:hypothetical protein K1719_013508 [Acacia pycnantha]
MDIKTAPMEAKSIFDHHHKPSRGGWNAAISSSSPTAAAARNVNLCVGFSFLFPLFGAFIADSYVGRFITNIISFVVYFLVYYLP